MLREMLRFLTFRKYGGASTIDMQFVRTVTGYRERTLRRKLYEMLLTLLIQFRYSKIVILRSYLSHAYFGSHVIGIRAAAKTMFQADPDDLTLDQAAVIAAMLVYPRPLSAPEAWTHKLFRRSKYGVSVYIANKQRFDQLHG